MDYGQLFGSVSGIAIGGYLFAVVYQGNWDKLWALLKEDGQGYLEFVIALLVLGAWHKYGPGGKVEGLITAIGLIAAFLKFSSSASGSSYGTVFANATKQFASGNMSLLTYVKAVLTGDYDINDFSKTTSPGIIVNVN